MSLIVKNTSILTTVQDLGRHGYRSLGINPSGVMDRAAARIINILLGNDQNEAVLEMHFPAGEFVFESDCSFAIGGADLGAKLNDDPVSLWSTATAREGEVLRFSERSSGNRTYLAVAGGFAIDDWLGSKSTNLTASIGGFNGRKLERDDRIDLKNPHHIPQCKLGPSLIPRYSRFPTVRVVAGGEFDLLTAISERAFLNEGFTISRNSNRMGFRLSGEPLHLLDQKEMVSAAVTFGTIQLLPDGQMIVLMADHQTSGGYPRIANVISVDLPIMAQLGPGDKVGFHLVSIDEAERSSLKLEKDLCVLKTGIRLSG